MLRLLPTFVVAFGGAMLGGVAALAVATAFTLPLRDKPVRVRAFAAATAVFLLALVGSRFVAPYPHEPSPPPPGIDTSTCEDERVVAAERSSRTAPECEQEARSRMTSDRW